jgi:hypothetical protein
MLPRCIGFWPAFERVGETLLQRSDSCFVVVGREEKPKSTGRNACATKETRDPAGMPALLAACGRGRLVEGKSGFLTSQTPFGMKGGGGRGFARVKLGKAAGLADSPLRYRFDPFNSSVTAEKGSCLRAATAAACLRRRCSPSLPGRILSRRRDSSISIRRLCQ